MRRLPARVDLFWHGPGVLPSGHHASLRRVELLLFERLLWGRMLLSLIDYACPGG